MSDVRIKELRKEKGLTQSELADILNVQKGTVSMWERGKRRPNFDIINKLSDIFDKNIGYILGFNNDASSAKLSEDMDFLSESAICDDYTELFRKFLLLDEYGQHAIEELIRLEFSRCREQQTLINSNITAKCVIKHS